MILKYMYEYEDVTNKHKKFEKLDRMLQYEKLDMISLHGSLNILSAYYLLLLRSFQ